MADVLRATKAVPGFHAAMRVVLVEASPRLRATQAQALHGYRPLWADSVQDLPRHPLFLVANEFFDALPIRQFQRAGLGWRERLVGLSGEALSFGLGPVVPIADLTDRLADTAQGDIVEICPQAPAIMAEIAARMADQGAALIIDYGGWHSLGDTFQAVQAHQPVDPFAAPGQADLTAHVDFAALAASAHPAAHVYTTQGTLLSALGLGQRSARLAQNLSGAALHSHLDATQRLTAPTEMGSLFKVLALYPAHHPAPPGSV